MNYIYDESFEGFLTCIYHHYYTEKATGIFPETKYQLDLINDFRLIETDEEKASKVYEAIETKISSYDIRRVYKVFRTEVEDKEMKLLRYIIFGFKKGSAVGLLHGHPIVSDVNKAEFKLGREIERLYGLVRFASVSGGKNQMPIMYSEIEPDNDVLEFLASHFVDRFKNEPFIIHDKKREKALIAYQRQWHISDFSNEIVMTNTCEEEEYRGLWQRYFDIIAIKERTNPKCQKNFMPIRYWKHLPEIRADKY